MNKHEQAEHDRAMERHVDVTLAGAQRMLTIMEADIKLCETEIPAEDTTVWNTTATRVFLVWKMFEGYGVSLMLNEHVRRILTMPGRDEVNHDIEIRLNRVDDWIQKAIKTNSVVAQTVKAMQWTSRTAMTLFQQHPGGKL